MSLVGVLILHRTLRVKASGMTIYLRYGTGMTVQYGMQVKDDSRVRHRTAPYGTARFRKYTRDVEFYNGYEAIIGKQ